MNVPAANADSPTLITAHDAVIKRLGYWTTGRRIEVRANRSLVVLDLLLPKLELGIQTSWHRADLTPFELGLSATSGLRYDIISGEES